MKLTLIRIDKHNERHATTCKLEDFFERIAHDTKREEVRHLRSIINFYGERSSRPDAALLLPRVCAAAELFKDKNGNLRMRQFNGVVVLSVAGVHQQADADAVKRQAAVLPTTLAAFVGSSGQSVKLLVSAAQTDGSLPVDEAEANRFCRVASLTAAKLYEALLGLPVRPVTDDITGSFALTFDPQAYVNHQSVPLRIDTLAPLPAASPSVAAPATDGNASEKVGAATRQLIDFFASRFDFRFNTVMGYTEYREKRWRGDWWKPVDDRVQNGLAMQARLAGLDVWDKDVRRFLVSDLIKSYDPIEEYLWRLHGKWDGRDHIARLAATVPTDNPYWPQWLRTWLLGMVAQWMGRNGRYGNAVAPLLISRQGYNKSTFCRSLVPDELQWGYTDNLQLSDKKAVLQQMSQMLLINLDEFNQISPALQQGFLKNVIQLPSVKVKRPYGKHVESLPRLASFIATSNMSELLVDPSGNRRFLGVELTGPIDVSVRPNHEQLYAQCVHLLSAHERHWFNDEETRQIMDYNQRFRLLSPAEQLFLEFFEPADSETDGSYLTAAAIYARLRKLGGSSLKATGLTAFGRQLSHVDGLKRKRTSQGTSYLVREKVRS